MAIAQPVGFVSAPVRAMFVVVFLAWTPRDVLGQPPPATSDDQVPVAAAVVPTAVASPHVRGCDTTSVRLLEQGRLRSPTVARLLAALDRSDVHVHVTTAPFLRVPGKLQFVTTNSGGRFLRITVKVPGGEAAAIESLAHELQHAVEVAFAPEITDDASLLRHYERHGQRICRGSYCTHRAQKTNGLVHRELLAWAAARR